MDRLVKLEAYSGNNLFAEEYIEEDIDLEDCRVEIETLENGIVVKSYYKAA